MPWPDDYILYSISVEDIRQIAEEEEFRELTDDEIKRIGDKVGDHIEWHEAVRMAIQEVAPDAANSSKDDEDNQR
jgi:hypothetical protein